MLDRLDRLFGKRELKDQISERGTVTDPSAHVSEKVKYQLHTGRIYIPFGGNELDMQENCPCCGGPYVGVLQQSCEYCNTSRKVFMLDITDRPLNEAEKVNLTDLIPTFGSPDCSIGDDSERRHILGNNVKMGSYSKVNTLGANSVNAESDCTVNTVVANKISTKDYFTCEGSLLSHEIEIGNDSTIGCLVLIDGGTATIENYTNIGVLVLGKNTKIVFQDDCSVGTILHAGQNGITFGDYCNVDNEKDITQEKFKNIAYNIITGLTKG